MDFRLYVKERSASSDVDMAVWESAVALLTQNGIETVRDLGSKGGMWIGHELYKDIGLGIHVEVDYTDPVRMLIKEIHRDCFDIVHNAHPAYDDGILIADCLLEYKPEIQKAEVTRIVNALAAVGIKTMTELCADYEKMRNVRGLGRDNLSLVMNMRTYLRDK